MRTEKREKPIYKSLHDFFVIRNSCHIIEVVGNEYYCYCKIGIKGDICKHVMALMYDRENFPIDPRLRSVKLGRKKRGVGRPSKVGPALSKSPPRNMVDIESFTETGEEDILLHDWKLPPPRTIPCSISPPPPPPPPSFSL